MVVIFMLYRVIRNHMHTPKNYSKSDIFTIMKSVEHKDELSTL